MAPVLSASELLVACSAAGQAAPHERATAAGRRAASTAAALRDEKKNSPSSLASASSLQPPASPFGYFAPLPLPDQADQRTSGPAADGAAPTGAGAESRCEQREEPTTARPQALPDWRLACFRTAWARHAPPPPPQPPRQ
jgi:hypothetical protein